MSNLNARKVATAGPGKHEDGNGLRLVVDTSGSRRWVLRFTLNGKRREMGIGSYPTVSLAEARDLAHKARQRVADGVDPILEKAREPVRIPSFTHCAAEYIRVHRSQWRNRKHARQWVVSLKTYVRPVLGHRPINAIGTEHVLEVLKPIWNSKTETAKRIQGRMENILDYAAAHNLRDPINPARWRGHLDKLLPRPNRVAPVIHHPAMPYEDVPAFMLRLSGHRDTSALALSFLILTAGRTSEILGATWSEIDLIKRLWIIPAERMKAGREHQVPLSQPVLGILQLLTRIQGEDWLFPGSKAGRPLSNMAMLTCMRRLGYGPGGLRGPYVPHGFRSSFRDWAGEVSSFPNHVCEQALAHVIANKAEAAYRRGNLLEKRRQMMEEWAAYATLSAGGKYLIPLAADPHERPLKAHAVRG